MAYCIMAWKNSKQLRNSSECKFTCMNGTISFGSILCFCFCIKVSVAIISTYELVQDAFEEVPRSTIQELNTFAITKSCVFRIEKLSSTSILQAIPISSIINKCVHIRSESKDFIIAMSNSYEHH